MTKENFKKYDKTKDIYCECCKQFKPITSYNYRNIKTNEYVANRCKTCDWFYRNHKGIIPSIKNYTENEIIEAVRFMFEDTDIYVNTLAQNLNRDIEDVIYLIYELNIKNIPIKAKTNCECCGKEIENNLSVYLKTRNLYCSLECYWKDKSNKIEHGEQSQFYNRIETNCTNCNKQIKIIPSHYNKINKFGDNHNFCSRKCYSEYRAKYYINEKSSMFNHEFTAEQKENRRILMVNNLKNADRLETTIQKTIDNLLRDNNISFEREKVFDYYSVDNYLPECNGIIEVMGDYWHTSPLKYNKDKYYINEMQRKQLHRDKLKYSYITNNYSIPILYLWETDINQNLSLCLELIKKYIENNKILKNYNSFNWDLQEGKLLLIDSIIVPYQDMSIDEYRYLIKTKKVG